MPPPSEDGSTKEVPQYMKNIHEANKRMFENRTNADVTLIIKDGPKDGTKDDKDGTKDDKDGTKEDKESKVRAHRYILESRCPKLLPEENKQELEITRDKIYYLSEFTLNEILKYLYYEHIELTSGNTFVVLQFSKVYDIPQLKKKCKNYIKQNINDRNVCKILNSSLEYKYEDIVKLCEDYISMNTKKVLSHEKFLGTTQEVVVRITGMDQLNVEELTLFEKCVNWAKHYKPSEKNEPVKDDSTKGNQENNQTGGNNAAAIGDKPKEEKKEKEQVSELRDKLGKAVHNFRFPVMQLDEFSSKVVPLNILYHAEVVEVYNYIAASKNNKPVVPDAKFKTVPRQKARKTIDTRYAPRSEDVVVNNTKDL